MTLSQTEAALIIAALRYAAIAHEEIAKIQMAKGDRLAARQSGGFGARCGELSDKLEREARGRPPAPRIVS